MHTRPALAAFLALLLALTAHAQDERPFSIETITAFDEPWSLAFLPDGRMLVTEKKGNLRVVTQASVTKVAQGLALGVQARRKKTPKLPVYGLQIAQ